MNPTQSHSLVDALTHCDAADLRRRIGIFLNSRDIGDLERVRIEVEGGVVTLSGIVDSEHDRWLCVSCCEHVAGVLHVVDRLQVDGHRNLPR